MRPLTEELLQSNHVNIDEDNTTYHGVGQELNPGKVVEEPSVNEPSHYVEDM